jgi:hypothetical protein
MCGGGWGSGLIWVNELVEVVDRLKAGTFEYAKCLHLALLLPDQGPFCATPGALLALDLNGQIVGFLQMLLGVSRNCMFASTSRLWCRLGFFSHDVPSNTEP